MSQNKKATRTCASGEGWPAPLYTASGHVVPDVRLLSNEDIRNDLASFAPDLLTDWEIAYKDALEREAKRRGL